MLKIKKSVLQGLIKEAIKQEVVCLQSEQKEIAHYASSLVEQVSFLSEHKNIKTKEQLLEFFGPFKKLGVADLEKISQKKAADTKAKDSKQVTSFLTKSIAAVEKARKALAATSVTDIASVESKLNDYVTKLADLHDVAGMAVDEKQMDTVSKPFAVAAYTLQKLSSTLSDAAEKLFSAVPRNDRIYDLGNEAGEVEAGANKFLLKPGGALRQMARNALTGIGGGSPHGAGGRVGGGGRSRI
jgi:hypothetical protein